MSTTAKTNKSDGSRMNIFYIIHVLEKFSDEEHPLSAADIAKLVSQEFGEKSGRMVTVSVDTVKRTMSSLIDTFFYNDTDTENEMKKYGYFIHTCMKKDGQYVRYEMPDEGKGENFNTAAKKYYYYDCSITVAEIRTLKDAIETYSYFSEEDISALIQKLIDLRPMSFSEKKYSDSASEERDEDSLLMMNINDLNDIIRKKKCVKITYCYYDKHKKLVPRKGYPKVVEPISLMWSNGYYYLLVYSEKYDTITNLRVDRISEIYEDSHENTRYNEKFNPVTYRHEHPIMYGGEQIKMTLLCRDTGYNYIMNVIMDVFGKNTLVQTADAQTVKKYLGLDLKEEAQKGNEWLRIVISSAAYGVEMWATQYSRDCLIIEPTESAMRVKKNLEEGISHYQNEI